MADLQLAPAGLPEERAHDELARLLSDTDRQKYGRFIFAILGAIPWVGAIFAASAALLAEKEQGRVNNLVARWLEEHETKYAKLEDTMGRMVGRLEQIGAGAADRVQDEQYLGLVRRGFRVWDEASTDEKRDYVRRTLTNAAGTKICSDDVVRLFLQWIGTYDELHFRAIRVLYKKPGATRSDMWAAMHGESVREDSAEADLFKLIIRDLSTGSVIRQHRETTYDGRFIAHKALTRSKGRSGVLASAFDDDKPYELTELGSQFVHYALNEVAPRLGTSSDDGDGEAPPPP